jgi:hypothetical protein
MSRNAVYVTTGSWKVGDDVLVTLWLPTANPDGSWSTIFTAGWPAGVPKPTAQTTTADTATSQTQSSTPSVETTSSTPASPTGIIETPGPTGDTKDSGVSTGALAGAAVACAIGGILLGCAVAWLLLRRRLRHARSRVAPPVFVEDKADSKAVPAATIVSTSGETQLNQYLLDTIPDGDIEAELQALGQLIDQHVETYYTSGPTAGVDVLSQALVRLGFTRNADPIAALCMKADTRHAALRHIIAQVIFWSIDIHSHKPFSMLPTPISSLINSMPEGQIDPGKKTALQAVNPTSNVADTPSTATSTALSQWRRLSAFLLHPKRADRSALPAIEATVRPQARALASALNTVLSHFVAPGGASHEAQTRHLQDVAIECTKLGHMLLSQPQDWHFVYETAGSNVLVVCPGLDKGRTGSAASNGRRVVEPVLFRLGAAGQ